MLQNNNFNCLFYQAQELTTWTDLLKTIKFYASDSSESMSRFEKKKVFPMHQPHQKCQ